MKTRRRTRWIDVVIPTLFVIAAMPGLAMFIRHVFS